MKCIVCNKAEIDETKAFPPVDIGGQIVQDIVNARRHALELERWEQVTVSINRGFTHQILVGHVCPADQLTSENVVLTKKKEGK